MGQETEYAIRFSPKLGHPGNDTIYRFLAEAIGSHVRTEPGLYTQRPQIFTQNGGAFHYECLPYGHEGGLIEGATPECRGPSQLLLYQKAQEALLLKAIPIAEKRLGVHGHPGKLGLLKNCRDAEGHVYGAQESFEAEVASGASMFVYRVGLLALLPLLALTFIIRRVAVLIALIGLTVAMLGAVIAALPPFRSRSWLDRLTNVKEQRNERRLYRVSLWLNRPFASLFSRWLNLWAFKRIRNHGHAFFVSRAVYSGAGSVDESGRFVLSEKAPAINRVVPRGHPEDRAIFDTGNLLKIALGADAHFHLLRGLFSQRQRLQLGLADSSMLEEAEFLKMGTTALVVDMAETGWLEDAPMLSQPVEALHTLVADPTLEATVTTTSGELSGLQIQRYYLERAKAFVADSKATSLEASEVVGLWEEVLTALEAKEMDRLVGRIDWVTKRYLLEGCESRGDAAMMKTIDLRYHEIGDGYSAQFARTGNVQQLLSPDEIENAVSEPPEGTPAYARGRFIRSRESNLAPVRISWHSALIGGGLKGKLIRFPTRPEAESDRGTDGGE